MNAADIAKHFRQWTMASCASAVAFAAAGCESATDAEESRASDVEHGLVVPDSVARIAGLEPSRVVLTVTLDGERIPVEMLDDGRGVARFPTDTIDQDETSSVVVTWHYDIGTRLLPLAEARREVVLADAPGISVSAYSDEFDDDGDGLTNLAELRESGGDWSSVIEPGMSSSPPDTLADCRNTRPDGFPEPLERAELILLNDPLTESYALQPSTEDGSVIYLAFYAPSDGGLAVEHTGGLPIESDAVLYDATLFGPPGRETEQYSPESVSFASQRDPGTRVRVPPPPTFTVAVGGTIMCYALYAADADGMPRPEALVDTVVEVTFVPR